MQAGLRPHDARHGVSVHAQVRRKIGESTRWLFVELSTQAFEDIPVSVRHLITRGGEYSEAVMLLTALGARELSRPVRRLSTTIDDTELPRTGECVLAPLRRIESSQECREWERT
jgi:hypothetical protein